MTRIVAISDTHGLHRELVLPQGDVLIHAGDITNIGELPVLQDFNDWLKVQPFKEKIVIAGNHDRCFESPTKRLAARKILNEAIYLENSGCQVEGLTFWGSPMTSTMPFWAFAYTNESERIPVWDKMPADLDVLITHTPPRNILDYTISNEHVGDGLLNSYIAKNKPKYNIFGHIHESYGDMQGVNTKFYNVSQVNEIYIIKNPPVVIEI